LVTKFVPQFLCDAMLGHIGRRLRAAGYDTLVDKGKIADDLLLQTAEAEGRILLTCDRGILKLTTEAQIVYLAENEELAWAVELSEKAGVDWLHAPMTRCLDCNTRLIEADASYEHRMPENIRRYGHTGLVCQTCDKVYWEGTHTQRMRAQLGALKQMSS
jgi:uncharacterized protein with PIN domain